MGILEDLEDRTHRSEALCSTLTTLVREFATRLDLIESDIWPSRGNHGRVGSVVVVEEDGHGGVISLHELNRLRELHRAAMRVATALGWWQDRNVIQPDARKLVDLLDAMGDISE